MVVLLVILTVLCFITVELAIRSKERRRVEASIGALDPATFLPYRPAHEMPGGLFFHGGHTWAKLEASGNIQVGLDGFAQGVLGKVDRYDLPALGKRLRQGEPAFAVLQSGKRIEFVAPVDGEVCAVNERLDADPRGVKEKPYEKGWALEIRPSNLAQDIRKLQIGADASAWLEKEVRRFVEFLTLYRPVLQEVGVTMPDGGVHTEGIMETMDGEILLIAVRKFFR